MKPFFVVNLADVFGCGLALLCVLGTVGWVALNELRLWWRRRR